MAFVEVQPDGAGKCVDAITKPDDSGQTVYRQRVTLGSNEYENLIGDLLTQILNELRALRIQDSQAMNVSYEWTENLIERNL
jgi:hypothetical protein